MHYNLFNLLLILWFLYVLPDAKVMLTIKSNTFKIKQLQIDNHQIVDKSSDNKKDKLELEIDYV